MSNADRDLPSIALTRHPDSGAHHAYGVFAGLKATADDMLCAAFRVEGDITALTVPAPDGLRRADELWRTTCFECFLKRPNSEAYRELNFSPSRAWASYAFTDYRKDMAPCDDIVVADTFIEQDARRLLFLACVNPGNLPLKDFNAGLAVILEDRTGEKSYWALAHPPGKPDFHHPSGFSYKAFMERKA